MRSREKKGKGHPFANDLHHGEHILWMSSSTKISSRDRLRAYFILIGSTLALFTVIIMADGAVTIDDISQIGRILGRLIGVYIVLLPFVFAMWYVSRYRRPVERAYAVTNERLLHRQRNKVSSI